MTAVGEVNTDLASKCMEFCQALASQGQAFNFSLAIGSSFSFSLDSRTKAEGTVNKKRVSPSTLRRNTKRRKEFIMKQQLSSNRITSEKETASKVLKCDQCDYEGASEKGLTQHKRMKHKKPAADIGHQLPTTPQAGTGILRSRNVSTESLICSPLLANSREENCQNCEAPFSPGHQCEDSISDTPEVDNDSDSDECDCSITLKSDYCCHVLDCKHPDDCECKTNCCQPGK